MDVSANRPVPTFLERVLIDLSLALPPDLASSALLRDLMFSHRSMSAPLSGLLWLLSALH